MSSCVDLENVCTEAIRYYRKANIKRHNESMRRVLRHLSEHSFIVPSELKGKRESLIEKEKGLGYYFLDDFLNIYTTSSEEEWCGPVTQLKVSGLYEVDWNDLYALLSVNSK